MSFVSVGALMILLVILELGIASSRADSPPHETLPTVSNNNHPEASPTQKGQG
jgi:hypothetical protein